MSTPTNPPAKHPPKEIYIQKMYSDIVGAGEFTSWRQVNNPEAPRYILESQHTALLQEERARARAEAFEDAAQKAHRMLLEAAEPESCLYAIRNWLSDRAQAARSPGDAEKEKKNDTTQVL